MQGIEHVAMAPATRKRSGELKRNFFEWHYPSSPVAICHLIPDSDLTDCRISHNCHPSDDTKIGGILCPKTPVVAIGNAARPKTYGLRTVVSAETVGPRDERWRHGYHCAGFWEGAPVEGSAHDA